MTAAAEDPAIYWNDYCNDNKNTTNTTDNNDNTCVPYEQIDWAVWGYFTMTCIVLIAALCGYVYIDWYHDHDPDDDSNFTAVHGDPSGYETVEAEAQLAVVDLSQTIDQSPRVGLELQDTAVTMIHVETLHQRRRRQEQQQQQLQQVPSTFPPPQRTVSLDHGYNHPITHVNTNANPSSDDIFVDEDHDEDGDDDNNNNNNNNNDTHISSVRRSRSHNIHNHNGTTLRVFHQVRAPALTIYLVFTVTLALFPGWISELRSIRQCQSHHHHRWDNDLYTPMAFVLFNVFDLMGRLLAGRIPVYRICPRALVTAACLRGLLFPLLRLCVGGNSDINDDNDNNPPTEIQSNLYSTMIQIMFATSNGFLVTLAFMYAPSVLAIPSSSLSSSSSTSSSSLFRGNTQIQERSAEILNFALSLGLLSGSCLSFLVSQWMR